MNRADGKVCIVTGAAQARRRRCTLARRRGRAGGAYGRQCGRGRSAGRRSWPQAHFVEQDVAEEESWPALVDEACVPTAARRAYQQCRHRADRNGGDHEHGHVAAPSRSTSTAPSSAATTPCRPCATPAAVLSSTCHRRQRSGHSALLAYSAAKGGIRALSTSCHSLQADRQRHSQLGPPRQHRHAHGAGRHA